MPDTSDRQRTWRFLRSLVKDQFIFALLMWAGFLALVLGTISVLARFVIDDVDNIPASGWESASGAVAWYAGGVAGWVVYHFLPLMIAHGRTRRDAAIELTAFMAAFAVFAAVLVTLGYLIESVVYRIGNWTHDIGGQHLFTAITDAHLMLLEYSLTYLVWGSAGALIGAGIYRNDAFGWLTFVPASILIGIAGAVTQWYAGPIQYFSDRLFDIGTLPLPVVIIVNLACFAAALALAWPIARDIPLRKK